MRFRKSSVLIFPVSTAFRNTAPAKIFFRLSIFDHLLLFLLQALSSVLGAAQASVAEERFFLGGARLSYPLTDRLSTASNLP
jgi:hypothetical protein